MATANEAVKKVLDNLNQRIASVGGVTDKWSDGNGNWWRKYSDGFIVQGGRKAANTVNISLNTPFSDLNYYFNIRCQRNSESSGSYSWYKNKTLTSIQSLENSEIGFWFACGY